MASRKAAGALPGCHTPSRRNVVRCHSISSDASIRGAGLNRFGVSSCAAADRGCPISLILSLRTRFATGVRQAEPISSHPSWRIRFSCRHTFLTVLA